MTWAMTKANSVRESYASFAGPTSTSGTKGSINLRIEARTRELIDQAASTLGKTRTEFMIDVARAPGAKLKPGGW